MRDKRGAPPIAAINEALATANIEAKINTILAVLNLDSPSIQAISGLPSSSRQFSLWAASSGSLCDEKNGVLLPSVDLKRNAAQTLRDRPKLTARVSDALTALSLRSDSRRLRGKKKANLEARFAFSEKLRFAAESALSDAVERCDNLQITLVKERAKFKSLLDKTNDEFKLRDEELQAERSKVSELTRSLHKISKMRSLDESR